ncbi:MAG: hypothetical protein IPG50_36910 [Myxococcales bacterium]|nr:hypothetical protein [Myxococcales bacterium]
MSPRRVRLGLTIVASVASWSVATQASPLLETVGAQGGSGGLAAAVTGPSSASAYFNPALLTEASDEVVLGLTAVSEQVGVTLDGRSGGDVPLVVGGRAVTAPDGTPLDGAAVPTEWLERGCTEGTAPGQCRAPMAAARPRQGRGSSQVTRSVLVLGGVKGLWPGRVTLGATLVAPLARLTTARSFYADEREALFSNSLHPELYGDRLTTVAAVVGAGVKVAPALSVGLGASLSLASGASAETYVRDSTNYDTLLVNNDVGVRAFLSPHVGFRVAPTPRVRLSGSAHAPQSMVLETDIAATLPNGASSKTHRRQVFGFLPWTVRLGTEVDLVTTRRYAMSAVAVAKFAAYGTYEDRQGQRPSAYGVAAKDTLTWTAGVRHRIGEVRGRIDLEYAPTPFPAQTGRSNYVDSDRVGIAAGVEAPVPRALLPKGPTVVPGLSFLVHRLAWRHQSKDDAAVVDEVPDGAVSASTRAPIAGSQGLQTNNPGWPGFGSKGWIVSAGVTVRLLWP